MAAPTTSLPEKPHGARNWDYRFCWLRDTTFTLLALMHAGYYHEAQEWQNWLLRAIAGSAEQVQIMYGVAGERHLAEWEVPWLAGYQGASPVRVGNAAFGQQQLDIYGELADALHQAREGKLPKNEPAIDLQRTLLEHLEHVWQEPDQGMWEVRGPRRRFTHSKVMAWVAFDRTIKSAEKFGLKAPLEHWRAVRRQIHDDVCRHGFDRDLGSFVQSYGAKNLDASLLLVPLVGFLPPSDPRVRGTIEKIERDLLATVWYSVTTPVLQAMDFRRERAHSWRAVSGWLTITSCRAGESRPRNSSKDFSRYPTTWVYWQRNTTLKAGASWAISRLHFRTWRWSTRR